MNTSDGCSDIRLVIFNELPRVAYSAIIGISDERLVS